MSQVYPLIILPNSPFKLVWNMVTIILLLYTATYVPYRVAFVDEDGSLSFKVFEYVVDSLFFFDIFVNFLSALELPNGSIETRMKIIVGTYLKSWFFLDIFACAPT